MGKTGEKVQSLSGSMEPMKMSCEWKREIQIEIMS